MPAAIPDDDKALGSGTPWKDMNQTADVLSELTGEAPGAAVPAGQPSQWIAGLWNPMEYAGAKGDGVTDDTAAVNATMAAMAAGDVIDLSGAPSSYAISAPLVVRPGAVVKGKAYAPPGKDRDAPIPTPPDITVIPGSSMAAMVTDSAFLAAAGTYTAAGIPSTITITGGSFVNGQQVILSGGTPPSGLSNGTVYYSVNASGDTFQAAASLGGAPIGTGSGSGTVTGAPVPSSAILISGLVVDGTGISGGAGHGIALLTAASSLTNCKVANVPGTGMLIADQTAAGNNYALSSGLDEIGIYGCRVYKPGVSGIVVQGNTGKITDGYITGKCIVDMDFGGTGWAIQVLNMPDWQVTGNHVYACPGGAYQLHACNQATIADNRADNFGQNSALGVTYVGFDIQVTPFGATTVRGNKCYTKEAAGAGAGNFVYYQITPGSSGQTNYLTFADNSCRQVSATSGTSTAYSYGGGSGGTLNVRGVNDPPYAVGTTISAVPVIASGTVNFLGFTGPGLAPSGGNDAANVQGLINLGVRNIQLQAGTFTASSTVTSSSPPTCISGAGEWVTTWNYTGSGDAFRLYTTSSYSAGGPAGGGIKDMTIDLSGASGQANGIHAGDIYNLKFNCGVRAAPGKGFWFDNNYWWAEQMCGRIWAEKCAGGHFVFDNSTGTSLGANATGSFARANLEMVIDQKGTGNGLVLNNGANIYDSVINYKGNFNCSATQYSAVVLEGSNAGGHSILGQSLLAWGLELNTAPGGGQLAPYTINFINDNCNIYECSGILDFAGGAYAFAQAQGFFSSFRFDGPVYGDGNLMRVVGDGLSPYNSTNSLINGGTIYAKYAGVNRFAPTANLTGMVLQVPPGQGSITLLNAGTGSVTFAADATSNVKNGLATTIAPGSAVKMRWDFDTSLWYALAAAPTAPGLALAPSGATGETFPRTVSNTDSMTMVSSNVYVSAISLPAGVPVNDITIPIGGTAFTTADVTHGWYALLDSNRVVRAISADQTSGNWGGTFSPVTLSVGASDYTTTYAGLYYVAFCVTFTGASGVIPTANAAGGVAVLIAPILAGTSSSTETTPPAVGTTLGALTGVANNRFYAYTS